MRDLEKYNEATRRGWRIFRFMPDQIKSGEAEAFMRPILTAQPSRAAEQGVEDFAGGAK